MSSETKVIIFPKLPIKKHYQDDYSNLIFQLFNDSNLIDSIKSVEFKKFKNDLRQSEAIEEVIYVFNNRKSI